MERNIALDILKLIMAFMVVGLHAGFLGEVTELGEYITTNGLFRLAVPIFFIISGFYFYQTLQAKQLLKWLNRVLLLYLIWMLLYCYFWLMTEDFSFVGSYQSIKTMIIGYHHLWYLPGLLGAALVTVLFRNLPLALIIFSILLTFFIGVFIQYAGNYAYFQDDLAVTKLFNQHWVHRNAVFLAYPFFCCGYLLNKYALYNKIPQKYAVIITISSLLALILESYINYYHPLRKGGFDNYISLILLCPAIFICFIKLNIMASNKNISTYSSAIYFVHPLVLFFLNKYLDIDHTLLTIFGIIGTLVLSYLVIKANNRIKYLL